MWGRKQLSSCGWTVGIWLLVSKADPFKLFVPLSWLTCGTQTPKTHIYVNPKSSCSVHSNKTRSKKRAFAAVTPKRKYYMQATSNAFTALKTKIWIQNQYPMKAADKAPNDSIFTLIAYSSNSRIVELSLSQFDLGLFYLWLQSHSKSLELRLAIAAKV